MKISQVKAPRIMIRAWRISYIFLCCLGSTISCGSPPAPQAPVSIVLITIEDLDSAASLAAVSLAAAEGSWRGFAIAASGARRPALASLLTGTRPWQHQLLEESTLGISAELPFLAQALGQMGYQTVANIPSTSANQEREWNGLLAGFGRVLEQPLDVASVEQIVAGPAPVFAWLHSAGMKAGKGRKIAEILAAIPLEFVVLITGVPGSQDDPSLDRQGIEFPLLVHWPDAGLPTLHVEPGGRVAQTRVWATLVELAGGRAAPAHAPSLTRPAASEILSELYGVDGKHQYSLLEGDVQLQWVMVYAESENERKRKAKLLSPPLYGVSGREVEMGLLRWLDIGTEPLHDSATRIRLAAVLEERWQAFSGGERSLRAELRSRSQEHLQNSEESARFFEGR